MDSYSILVVDDSGIDRKLVTHILEGMKSEVGKVYAVASAEEALEFLQSPEASEGITVFLDLYLPRMDGWEMLEAIRRDGRLQGLHAFVLSSSSKDEDISRAYELGIDGYLFKGVPYAELKDCLRSACEYVTH